MTASLRRWIVCVPVWWIACHVAGAARAESPVPPTIREALVRRGTGDLRGALKIAEAVVVAEPGDGSAWTMVGDLRYASGDRAGALAAFRTAVASGLHDARVDGLIAELAAHPAVPLAMQGSGAGVAGDAAIEAAFVRALTAFSSSRFGEASELAAALVAAHPDHWEGWTLLGRCRAVRGDAAGAQEAWARSLGLQPDQPELVAMRTPPDGASAVEAPVAVLSAGPSSATASSPSTAVTIPDRGRTSPVIPGPVRSAEQAAVPPPPSRSAARPSPGGEADIPLDRMPSEGARLGPQGGPGAARRGAWQIGLGGGVMGHGLTALREQEDEQDRLDLTQWRQTGATVTLDSTPGAMRIPVHLELRWQGLTEWGLLGRIEMTPESESASSLDIRSPFFATRLVQTVRRRSGMMASAVGGWVGREVAPRLRIGGTASVGGVYAWRTVVQENDWWWNPAGPPERDTWAVGWRGWGVLGDVAAEGSYAVAGPLRVFLEAGWRLAWVPRMTATVVVRDRDGDGVPDPERVVDREPGEPATRYDFSAWRAAAGVRLAL